MFKKFLIITCLFIVNENLAMENFLDESKEESFTIPEKTPEDMWQLIANNLPSNNRFLNMLSRYIYFDEATYERIIDAMLYEIEEIPLASELDTFLDDHYKVSRKKAITQRIRRSLLTVLKHHPLFKMRGTEGDIERLHKGTYIFHQGTSIGTMRSGLQSVLTAYYEQEYHNNVTELTSENMGDLLHPMSLAYLDNKELADYTHQVKIAQRNVKHLLKIIDEAPIPFNRTDFAARIRMIRDHKGYIIKTMMWNTALASPRWGNPLLLFILIRQPLAIFCLLFLPEYSVELAFDLLNLAYPWLLLLPFAVAIRSASYKTFKSAQEEVFAKDERSYRAIKEKYKQISNDLTSAKQALNKELELFNEDPETENI